MEEITDSVNKKRNAIQNEDASENMKDNKDAKNKKSSESDGDYDIAKKATKRQWMQPPRIKAAPRIGSDFQADIE